MLVNKFGVLLFFLTTCVLDPVTVVLCHRHRQHSPVSDGTIMSIVVH